MKAEIDSTEVCPVSPFEYKAEYLDINEHELDIKNDPDQLKMLDDQVKEEMLLKREYEHLGIKDERPGMFMYSTPDVLLKRYKDLYDIDAIKNQHFDELDTLNIVKQALSEMETKESLLYDGSPTFDEIDVKIEAQGTFDKENISHSIFESELRPDFKIQDGSQDKNKSEKIKSEMMETTMYRLKNIWDIINRLEIKQESTLFEYINYKLQQMHDWWVWILSEKFISETIECQNDEQIEFKLWINEKHFSAKFEQDKDTNIIKFVWIEREEDEVNYVKIDYDKFNSDLSSDEIKFIRQEFIVKQYPYKFDAIKQRYEEAFPDKYVTTNQLQTMFFKIKGRPFLQKTEDELISDLKKIKTLDKNAFIVINKGIPTVALVQTSRMVENWYRYGSVLQLHSSSIDSRFSQYKMHVLVMSGIAPNGQTLIFGVAFFSILWKESYEWIFKKLREKYAWDGIFSSTLITSLDRELREAVETILGTTWLKKYKDASTNQVGTNQISVIVDHYSVGKHLLSFIKNWKEKDTVIKMMWKLVTNIHKPEDFMLLKDNIISKVLELRLSNRIQLALEEIFDWQHCWWLTRVAQAFTKGLHEVSKYTGALMIDKILFKMETAGADLNVQDFLNKIEYIAEEIFVKEWRDGETGHLILTQLLKEHNCKNVYESGRLNLIKRDFTSYGMSLILSQIVKSFSLTSEQKVEDEIFFVKDGEREFIVEKINDNTIICSWMFNQWYKSFWSHIFSVIHKKDYNLNQFAPLSHQFRKEPKDSFVSFFVAKKLNTKPIPNKAKCLDNLTGRKRRKIVKDENGNRIVKVEEPCVKDENVLKDSSNNVSREAWYVQEKKREQKEIQKVKMDYENHMIDKINKLHSESDYSDENSRPRQEQLKTQYPQNPDLCRQFNREGMMPMVDSFRVVQNIQKAVIHR